MYAHKKAIIKNHSPVVRRKAGLAEMLGRKVATDATAARKILGLKLTLKS